MVSNILETLGDLSTGFITLLKDTFSGVVSIFYEGGSDGEGFTVLGVFLLIGLVLSLIWIVFKVIRKIVKG